jgi:hypothetical protein
MSPLRSQTFLLSSISSLCSKYGPKRPMKYQINTTSETSDHFAIQDCQNSAQKSTRNLSPQLTLKTSNWKDVRFTSPGMNNYGIDFIFLILEVKSICDHVCCGLTSEHTVRLYHQVTVIMHLCNQGIIPSNFWRTKSLLRLPPIRLFSSFFHGIHAVKRATRSYYSWNSTTVLWNGEIPWECTKRECVCWLVSYRFFFFFWRLHEQRPWTLLLLTNVPESDKANHVYLSI